MSNKDIELVSLFVFIIIVFITVPQISNSPIRTIFGILMVLFLPGYSLISALFIRKDDIDDIERIALSFGMSIAIVPLIGLGLNYTPFGIRLLPVLFSISIFTLGMCFIAYKRRQKIPENERFFVDFSKTINYFKEEIFSSKPRIDKILTILLLISIMVSVITLIYVIVTPKQGEKFTEFYILGDNGMASDYPKNLSIGNNSSIIIGISNHEYRTVNYTVNLLLNNRTLNTKNIKLVHNFTWEKKIYFIPDIKGDDLKLEFLLYKDYDFSVPYRELHLWVNVS